MTYLLSEELKPLSNRLEVEQGLSQQLQGHGGEAGGLLTALWVNHAAATTE